MEEEGDAVRTAIEAVRAGRKEAFGRLVEIHQGRVTSLVLGLLRDRSAAEEVAQDAFTRAWLQLDAFDIRRPFYPWLAKIAYRLALTRWQRLRREASLRQKPPVDLETSGEPDALESVVADEAAVRLWRAVESLPAGARTAVLLYYRQGLTVAEVAGVLGVSQGSVKTQLFRARRHLKRALSPDGET
jgi:RNA polymerase sigma-70 factor (ECF subfamily)